MTKGKTVKSHAHDHEGTQHHGHHHAISAEDVSSADPSATDDSHNIPSDHGHGRRSHPHTHTSKHDHHDPIRSSYMDLYNKMSAAHNGDEGAFASVTGHMSTTNQSSVATSETSGGSLLGVRKEVKDLWKVCCNEVATEREECNKILAGFGLPPYQFSKEKAYPLTDYDDAPDLQTSKGKDFLDFYVFPVLLPGIQSLLQFGKDSRAFQCKLISFDAIDYMVQYLYNNNPRYPERLESPTNLYDIHFVKSWLEKYPRPRPAKWMTMSKDEAARIIQRNWRGFFARIRPDVGEMREFWATLRKEKLDAKLKSVMSRVWRHGPKMTIRMAALTIQKAIRGFIVRMKPNIALMRQHWKDEQSKGNDGEGSDSAEGQGQVEMSDFNLESLLGQDDISSGEPEVEEPDSDFTHSETCVICAKLREFVQAEEMKAAVILQGVEEEDEEEEDEDEMIRLSLAGSGQGASV